MSFPRSGDIVFVDSLQVNTNLGPDCWSKTRPQPTLISVYLYLRESFLDKAGETDDVADSVHYGHLAKAITALVDAQSRGDVQFGEGVDGLADAVTEEAFKLAGEAAAEVRVVVSFPKMILLAGGCSIEVCTLAVPPGIGKGRGTRTKKVTVHDLVLATIIGVNPPEREAKQRVITNLVFYEEREGERFARILNELNMHKEGQERPVDYARIVGGLAKVRKLFFRMLDLDRVYRALLLAQDIEESSYLTLEKFVREVARKACLAESARGVQAVTVRAQKPSAISFADSSGVEITRTRASFKGHA